LDYPKLEKIFDELDFSKMFNVLNLNLKEIKEGILNLITGNDLSQSQKSFINIEEKSIFQMDEKFKKLNTFILFEDYENLSSTARNSYFLFS
jgi:hypothetical protein